MGSFEEAWPELQKGLQRNLARRGVPPWKADDVIQETGLRLFRCWENVDPERSPFGLALRVANNIMWDEARKHRGREILSDEVPEKPAAHDVEELSLARMELHRARKLLDRLNPNHRSVLLAEVGAETIEERNSAATKMVRMRARKRLSALMSNASSFGFLPFAIKDLARRFSDFARRNLTLSEQASATAVAAVSVVAAVVVLGVPSEAPASVDENLRPLPNTRSLGSAELASARKAIRLELAEASTHTSTTGKRHATGATVTQESEGGDYDVAVPEGGPADGGATFGVVPDEDENWSPSLPTCSQDADPTDGTVGAGCYVDGPGDDVNAGTDLTIRP